MPLAGAVLLTAKRVDLDRSGISVWQGRQGLFCYYFFLFFSLEASSMTTVDPSSI